MADKNPIQSDFIHSNIHDIHKNRTKAILAAHPEMRKLFGASPSSLIYIALIVSAQIALAILLREQSFWLILLFSYVVGAFLNHGLFVFIHESSHNLVLKSSFASRILGIITNLPIGFPMAMSFRKYHLLHHQHQGDMELDADIPTYKEARFIGDSRIKKSIWLALFLVVEGLYRPAHLKKIQLFDKWSMLNIATEIVFVSALVYFFGWMTFVYLILSTLFSVGFHPLGGRWIQEHYVVKPDQETYSYYGPLNALTFDIGYHNEHHDFMLVSWRNLAKVRATAPEFYNTLHYHTSWTRLLVLFLFQQKVNLFSRVIRTPQTHIKTMHEVEPSAV